jgi:signal transduction histidine kinase/DNA-binding response OmpR family regulator
MWFNRAYGLIFLPIAMALGIGGFLTIYFSRNLDENRFRLVHAYEVMDKTRGVIAELQEVEAAQRDYVFTGQQTALSAYQGRSALLPSLIAEIRSLTADDTQQQQRLGTLGALVAARLEVLQRGIDAARSQGFTVPHAALDASPVNASDEVRATVRDIIAHESGLLNRRVEATRRSERYTLYAAIAGSTAGLLGVLVVGVLLLGSNRALRTAQQGAAQKAILLQGTLDNVREGIAAFDREGKLEAFNARFFRLLRLSPDLAKIGVPIAALRDAEIVRVTPALRHALFGKIDGGRDGIPVVVGRRHLEIYRDVTTGGSLIVSCFDITRRTNAEETARQAQKMEAIGQLTGGVAHDFNNLLQVISSNLDLLVKDIGGNERAAGRLNNAIAGAERGARLTRQLLAFARREPLEPRPVDIGRQLTDMGELLRRTLGESIAVETQVATGLWNTLVDATRLESALLNLAINARDAMPDGGRLVVTASNAVLDAEDLGENRDIEPGEYVLLGVADTGRGMNKDVLRHAFEPFFTTKPEGHGTGLGLSQVFGFVKQSGGHIRIDSAPGRGTTVEMFLPRTHAVVRKDADLPAQSEGGAETILVVEDHAEVRRAVVDTLESLGYRVLEAASADAALEILEDGEAIDLLFTDVIMPGAIKAPELARRARESNPSLAVLFTSGYAERAIIHDGHLDQGVQLLSKPYRQDELARKVRAVLAATKDDEDKETLDLAATRGLPAASGAPPRRLRILVVEDEIFVRLTTMDMLDELGHEAIEAENARAALKVLNAVPDIDMMLTDIGLPDVKGPALAAECRRLRPKTMILFVTGYDATSLSGEDAEAVIIGKPFDIDDLRRAIATALKRQPAQAAA